MAKKEVDDRFKKFGTVSFTAITKTNDFIAYLETARSWGRAAKIAGWSSSRPDQTATNVCPVIWNGLR